VNGEEIHFGRFRPDPLARIAARRRVAPAARRRSRTARAYRCKRRDRWQGRAEGAAMARVPSKRATSTFISWRCARRSTSMAKATAMWSQFPAAAIGWPVWPTIVMSAAKPQTRL